MKGGNLSVDRLQRQLVPALVGQSGGLVVEGIGAAVAFGLLSVQLAGRRAGSQPMGVARSVRVQLLPLLVSVWVSGGIACTQAGLLHENTFVESVAAGSDFE